MKATFDGMHVRLGAEGKSLYEQSGYGRPERDGLRLAPEEALYLLHRGRIEVPGHTFDSLLALFAANTNFMRSFLVYRDIRERGYAVQTGPHDFRVFRRGQKPGRGPSQYSISVVSERDLIVFQKVIEEVSASRNIRKQHVLAAVDDENELTYYEVKIQVPEGGMVGGTIPHLVGELVGRNAIVHTDGSASMGGWGMQLDADRLVLSPLEILCLMRSGNLVLTGGGAGMDPDTFARTVRESDVEFPEKMEVYEDLRRKGLVPRTGYKFGHHFRVYTGRKIHSEMLVQALPGSAALPMSSISRSVRLAHSVKKKMLFACIHNGGIRYVEFARIKL
ncbi:MAG: tRNA-intron lyase [Methanolinea sp.]|nr:tRNA-intron lyase [Methanolinea sp.]